METSAVNDAELVQTTLAGDRDAFGQIVARYQSLICTLAYSATGNIGQSEDLAQETFLTAWKQLAELREPEKLRAWLCGIARNLVNNSLRKQQREPSHAAESIETISENHAPGPLPVEHTISNEEQALLWRSLEKIPETYREPMVLFYRENQSVEVVAEKLELTPDTVHQRLSRGRKLLTEEVTTFVESALARTNPGQAFTIGVLAALPITLSSSAKAATMAAAAKGGATVTGKSLASVVLGILSGPALGFLFGFLGWRESLKTMRTPRERASVKRDGIILVVACVLFFVICSVFGSWVSPLLWDEHPVLVLAMGWALMMSWVVYVGLGVRSQIRKRALIREEERQRHPELFRDELPEQAWEYRSRATLLGLPLIHWQWFGKVRRPDEKIKPAVGWIAVGQRAYGILFASGGLAVGGIATGGFSFGLIALGGCSVGLLALGGFAFGGIALGGGAVGYIASGGMAIGWLAAHGGIVAAHEFALGGAALGNHINDDLAQDFFENYRWLDFNQSGPRNLFWLICFGPMFIQMLIWVWWRRKTEKRAEQV
jgi:RNA polymerase sigma factor (sigma-70 family)